jgi:hypothetical protein
MIAFVFLVFLLPSCKSDTDVSVSKDSLIERQTAIINELLGEMKVQQLKDRKDIVRNREEIEKEILELKKENENLKAMVVGKNNDQHLKDEERVKDHDTSAIGDLHTTSNGVNKRGMLVLSLFIKMFLKN